jgi:hypothetical protein
VQAICCRRRDASAVERAPVTPMAEAIVEDLAAEPTDDGNKVEPPRDERWERAKAILAPGGRITRAPYLEAVGGARGARRGTWLCW